MKLWMKKTESDDPATIDEESNKDVASDSHPEQAHFG